jgi:hypothetical protein
LQQAGSFFVNLCAHFANLCGIAFKTTTYSTQKQLRKRIPETKNLFLQKIIA